MFDKNSPTPLYKQLKEILKQSIHSGIYKEHEKIPTEKEIEQKYNVSRITVRRAVSDLVEEGYLLKQPGKGTFVTFPKLEHTFDYAQSFSKNIENSNYYTHSQILSTEVVPSSEVEQEFSAVNKYPYQKYYAISKLRFINDMPAILEINYYPLPKMESVVSFDHSISLFKNLKEHYKIPKLFFINGIFSVKDSSHDIASKLNIPYNSPVICIHQTAVDDKKELLYFGKQIVNRDSYVFRIPEQEVDLTF